MKQIRAVISLVLPLRLILVLFYYGDHFVTAQTAENGVKIPITSAPGRPETPSMVREPRQTYFARIMNENPKHEDGGTQDASGSHENGSGKNGDAISGSSSSSSSEENMVVLGSISSTTPNPSATSQKKGLQVLTKLQQGRALQSDNGHNWYKSKSKIHGRNVAPENSTEESDFVESSGVRTPILLLPSGRSMGSGDTKKRYDVIRTKPNERLDPGDYNFFQFKPYSKFGWMWLSVVKSRRRAGNKKSGLAGRFDMLASDKGDDEDDLDPSNHYDWEFRRYDRACLYVEYTKKKYDAVIPIIPEDLKRVVDGQNELMARKFLDWQFVNKDSPETIALQEEGDKHPLHLTYKILQITMELFRDKICRNASSYAVASTVSSPPGAVSRALATANTVDTKLLPKPFVEDLFRLFLTLREITLTKNIPDYATQLDDEEVYKAVLVKCKVEEENINWYSHSCGDQILSNDEPNNFACTPLVDYDFNSRLYDPVLDSMWHMFNSVHAYCFKQFQVNTRLWHRYSLIVANSFTVGMRQRWKASMASQKFYMRLLGPDHEVHLETMNRCMFATVLRSDVPAVIPRFDSVSPITFGKERIIHKDGTVAAPKP